MKRHPFDALSFVAGLLFLGLGVPLLVSDADFSFCDGTWIFPAFLILAGVVVLISARSSASSSDEADSQPFD